MISDARNWLQTQLLRALAEVHLWRNDGARNASGL